MFKNVVPITLEKHRKKLVKTVENFEFASKINMASVMVYEFSRAASIYPIVFVEDKRKDQFKPVALLGLEEGENLFVQDDKWQASYIPAIIRRYPFALAKTDEEGRFTVCIDDESDLVNEKEGQALFNDKGEPSELTDRVKQYLAELQQMDQFTEDLCKYLAEKNMFTPLNMKVRIENEMRNITGAYIVNEERLNSLSDETYLEMRAKKYIPVLYAHLSSLPQIERLLTFKGKKKSISVEELGDRFSGPEESAPRLMGQNSNSNSKRKGIKDER
jgi:hypothetical protein